ncbi:MAG: hypothetical protein R2755_16730 [Acidimicrobiales bacterium]
MAVGVLDGIGQAMALRRRGRCAGGRARPGGCSSPATTPRTSSTGRFWLSLRLASMRSTVSSTPTMPRSMVSTYSSGASSSDQVGAPCAASNRSVSAATMARSSDASCVTRTVPCTCTTS